MPPAPEAAMRGESPTKATSSTTASPLAKKPLPADQSSCRRAGVRGSDLGGGGEGDVAEWRGAKRWKGGGQRGRVEEGEAVEEVESG